ncbi:MAG: hypothetical protein ACRC5M_04910 [Anaeroplasmataceae bacterium]
MVLNLITNDNLFRGAVSSKKYKCPYCIKIFNNPDQLYFHVETSHKEEIPEGTTVKQAIYDKTHPGDHLCQICKVRKCVWKEKTCRYSTLCDDKTCREEARRRFKDNFKKKHGKDHSINDPDTQREMLKRRKTSGLYKFQDEGTLEYASSFEKDFLELCDLTLNIPSDKIQESHHVFPYQYEGKEHFYMPDYFMPDYNLIIEIKADDDISHPKILSVDKEKEALKDQAVIDSKTFNFIKICDKKYEQFVDLLEMFKSSHLVQGQKDQRYIIIPERKADIRGFKMPKLKFISSLKTMTESIIMQKILDSTSGELDVSLVIDKDNVPIKEDPLFKDENIFTCKTNKIDFKSDSDIHKNFKEFAHYYTKMCEHFINQDFMSIRMDLSKTDWFAINVKFIDGAPKRKLMLHLVSFCEHNDLQVFSFVDTSLGFLAFIGNLDETLKSKLNKYIDSLKGKSDYSKSMILMDEHIVQLPGSVDAGVDVNIIQI